MTTFAQLLYINANPDKSHNFENNEDFEQFRDEILLLPGMTLEKTDRNIEAPMSKSKDTKLTSGTIFRRSHNLIREELTEGTEISDVQRFLVHKLYEISLRLGDIENTKFQLKWDERIEPHLKKLTSEEEYKCVYSMNTKLSTISGKDSKTFQTYLRGTKKEKKEKDWSFENVDDAHDNTMGTGKTEDDSNFKIPK